MAFDRQILQRLAAQYAACAYSDRYLNNMLLHRQVNDLKGPRPILLIDEIPWQEMDWEGELTLQCQDPFYREMEWYFRTWLYKWRHLPADMVLPPFYGVAKRVSFQGIGIQFAYDQRDKAEASAHLFADQLQTEEDLEKLHNDRVFYDQEASLRDLEKAADVLQGVLPVKLAGFPILGCTTWDDIVRYRGLDSLFYDLVERPDFVHRMVDKLTDIYLDRVRQLEELNLFEANAFYLHCTAGLTNGLHPETEQVGAKDVWGRGTAQIFASVSPDMHDEVDIQYMKRAMEPFGLVYYGCCEPLDKKIHIVEQLPHLRKISITPWANVDSAAEQIGSRYVLAAKPNPACMADSSLDEDAARKELRRIVSACKRNGCSCDIVLKDITTVCRRPQNLVRWQEIAMEEVQR